MDRFLKIIKVFNNPNERKVGFMKSIYSDYNRLSEIIDTRLIPNTFKEQIKNKRILLKPNWVNHSRRDYDEICLRTHDHFTLAVLKIILESGASEILIGDAPIQGCVWERMISASFLAQILELSKKYTIPVRIKDFRRRTYSLHDNYPTAEINPISDYIIFDLGKESFLEPITESGSTRFRVTNYDPDRMTMAHAPGVHKYCIARDFFNADIVLSLPKIKTHQKAGITGALKNIVGINGDKDFLPHHRLGGTKRGGDCYPGGSLLKYWAELLLDKANRRQGKNSYRIWQKASTLLWLLSFPGLESSMAAGWFGNDTTWRMVKDLNRIAECGCLKGTITNLPSRIIYSICDGIIAGQGDGPLEPDPLPLGVVSFTNNSLLNDLAMSTLMGLTSNKIPLLSHTTVDAISDCIIEMDNKISSLNDLKGDSIATIPPIGWVKYFA